MINFIPEIFKSEALLLEFILGLVMPNLKSFLNPIVMLDWTMFQKNKIFITSFFLDIEGYVML